MFSGQETARFKTGKSRQDIERIVQESLESPGEVEFFDKGELDVRAGKLGNFLTDVKGQARIRRPGPEPGESIPTLDYQVQPPATCWVLGILRIVLRCLIRG